MNLRAKFYLLIFLQTIFIVPLFSQSSMDSLLQSINKKFAKLILKEGMFSEHYFIDTLEVSKKEFKLKFRDNETAFNKYKSARLNNSIYGVVALLSGIACHVIYKGWSDNHFDPRTPVTLRGTEPFPTIEFIGTGLGALGGTILFFVSRKNYFRAIELYNSYPKTNLSFGINHSGFGLVMKF
jgi:hypothetical protein